MDPVARLIAIEEIRQLKARYFRLIDDRDFQGWGALFCEDAVFDCSEGLGATPVGGVFTGPVGPIVQGRDALIRWVSGTFATITSVHHGHDHEIHIDSETEAHGIIAMEDMLRRLDRQTMVLHAAGHYHERYRKEGGEWRIASTCLTRLFARYYDGIDPATL